MSVIEIPDFVNNQYAEYIENHILREGFPWFYQKNVTRYRDEVDCDEDHNSGFYHMIYLDDTIGTHETYNLLIPLILSIEEKTGIKLNKLHRMRLGLLINNSKGLHDQPHIDFDFPHYTACYYVNDSEGDTFVFNETYSEQQPETFSIKHRSSPQRGKLTLFDGSHYHASSKPKHDIPRIVLTVNFS